LWTSIAVGLLKNSGNLLGYYPPEELVAELISKLLFGSRHFNIDKVNIHKYMHDAMSSILLNELRKRKRETLCTAIIFDEDEVCLYSPLDDFPDKDLQQIYFEQDMQEQINLFRESLYGDDVWLLDQILAGYSNEAISKQMRLCVPLVKNKRRQMIGKLRVHFNNKSGVNNENQS